MLKRNFFEKFSDKITAWAGSSMAFGVALGIVIGWGVSGPIFGYSDTWQLVINTGTTIITFLMVFLIQKSQNKDSKAIQIKLNELVAATKTASNRMVNVEDFTEEELDLLHKFYEHLAKKAKGENDIHQSHSIDRAEQLHITKKGVSAKEEADKSPEEEEI